MDKLKTYAKEFAHKSMIDDFKKLMVPEMEKCKRSITEYTNDNKTVKECVLNMDAALCNKVNKIKFIELENMNEIYNQEEARKLKEVMVKSD